MDNVLHYDFMVRALRNFFQYEKGFIEVPAQSRLSILAACENPKNITQFSSNNKLYPLPQTGQMWLEYEMLKNPQWPGVFCVTTSYRDEQHIVEGRHKRIFPMFEFEAPGTFEDLKLLEAELLSHLGFNIPINIDYITTAQAYETDVIEAEHELALEKKYGPIISLEEFPECTHPFWNVKRTVNGLYRKVDVLLYGMETIELAERETNIGLMQERFFTLENGQYCNFLFTTFGKDRVLQELNEYLTLPMSRRFAGGIGLTRLERAMKLAGLFDVIPHYAEYMTSRTQLTL